MLIESGKLASLTNTSFMDSDEGVEVMILEESGNYEFSRPEKKWSLIAYNEDGYRRISDSDYYDDSTIVLEPWGRLEGYVLLDNVPLKNHNIVVNPKTKEIAGTLWQSHKLRTDENGKFEVNRIAPENYWIGLPSENPEGFIPEIAEIEINSGQTINLTIECIAQQATY